MLAGLQATVLTWGKINYMLHKELRLIFFSQEPSVVRLIGHVHLQ
jgi:hypothetical protein